MTDKERCLQEAFEQRSLADVTAILTEEPSCIDGKTTDGIPFASMRHGRGILRL